MIVGIVAATARSGDRTIPPMSDNATSQHHQRRTAFADISS
jgi:hypothetical protein